MDIAKHRADDQSVHTANIVAFPNALQNKNAAPSRPYALGFRNFRTFRVFQSMVDHFGAGLHLQILTRHSGFRFFDRGLYRFGSFYYFFFAGN